MAQPKSQPKPQILVDTERAQTAASDPLASVWVSANAGAGKTHVLKRRVLRILLAGTRPDRILCLTYTKAAAAEMASRVFDDLARWATIAEDDLADRLADVLDRAPTLDERREARKLFARAIETPGGLKVQTIHAFCERLLQRFPLEAGVPPGFSILDDSDGAALRRSSIDAVLTEATRKRSSPLGKALDTMIAFAAGDGFDDVLRGALLKRDWLETSERLMLGTAQGIEAAEKLYRRAFEVRERISLDEIVAELAGVITDTHLKGAAIALGDGGKNDSKLADLLRQAASVTGATRIALLQKAFLTEKMEARSDRFVSKKVQDTHPEVFGRLQLARDRFEKLMLERQGLVVAEASAALIRIASAVMQRYTEGKAMRAALDFDDLVARTSNLLARSSAAEWVLYKLDGGLDHVLVDEAQDTSPIQWSVIESLAREFFSGGGAREEVRSVFAVGDEKQSIYSFQGAEPRMFAATGRRFAEGARSAGLTWRTVPLTLSFRTVEPLLAAVDKVFADYKRTPGIAFDGNAIRHLALRRGHAGLIEIWKPEEPRETESADTWDPFGEKTSPAPAAQLAARIATTIKGWIDRGEMLASQGRPIRAGDILILVRRRHPFAGPMVSALKTRGIPVAGADRLALVDQLAVRDLLALGEFLTLPEDDLSLAAVLKSPLFSLNDDDLLVIAPKRKGSLWSALIAAAKANPRFAEAAETLRRWRGTADQWPPFEFYAGVLDRDGGRRKLVQRLGPEAIDPITEFLNQALAYDEAEPPSLTGFLDHLRTASPEIKRDMEHGRDEVRVLTVHGSKGLEAPIVFLPDTCSARAGYRAGELVALEPDAAIAGATDMHAWPVKGAKRLAAIEAGKTAASARETEERNRLLYVAMTRARDRLYVAGYQGTKGRDAGCWYDLVCDGLGDMLTEMKDEAGNQIRRCEVQQTVDCEKPRKLDATAVAPLPPPAWADAAAPHEPHLSIPLAPSRLAPYDIDDMADAAEPGTTPTQSATREKADTASQEPPSPSPLALAGDRRFLRGTLTHALLEHLPTLDPTRWQEIAEGFVATRGPALPSRTRASIVTETLAVLRDPAFAPVFSATSRAEVPIVAEIPALDGKGPPLRLNGQLDRLAVTDHEVLIVDYKTNRPPPTIVDGVAPAYLYQLAAYVLALRGIYPGRSIRAGILWTDGPRLMEIPQALIDQHIGGLWQLVRNAGGPSGSLSPDAGKTLP